MRLNSRVAALTAERAILDTGEVIETNTVVTTVGNATHPVIKNLIDRYRLANAKGRVLTEPTLQVKGHKNLWAAGDCAAVPLSDGSMSPATAQFALRQGTLLGKNLLARRANRPLRPFRFKALGEMASLGHLNAVGDVLGFKVSGLFAWLMWRAIYLSKLPGLQRKLQVFLEWTWNWCSRVVAGYLFWIDNRKKCPEVEFTPFDLYYISRQRYLERSAPTLA